MTPKSCPFEEEEIDRVFHDWTRVGCGFCGAASAETPDLERLLIRTTQICPWFPRLFTMPVTWLKSYGHLVQVPRLMDLAKAELNLLEQATLGLLLETAVEFGAPAPLLDAALKNLSPVSEPAALCEFDYDFWDRFIEREANATSRRWGRYMQDIQIKEDAMRTERWIYEHNPSLAERNRQSG